MIPFSDAFNSVLTPSTVGFGVAPQYGKNPDGSVSGGLLNGMTQIGQALGAAAPFVQALNGKQPVTVVANQRVPLVPDNQGQGGIFDNMDNQTKILLAVGGVALVGLIVFVATRK
jgi:hypothetical protein